MVWKPHVTVAAVIENNAHFLLVEETTDNGIAFNQPAGHLEAGEDLITAVKREVAEETAWQFEPEAVVAIQLWRRTPDFPSFMRFCFTGKVHSYDPNQKLDDDIIAAHWLSRDDILQKQHQLRSPLVLLTVDEYLKGQRHPLSILQSFLDLA
ncbi:NUDIX hydrolase [Methylomonas lenta]|uniref:Phosphatase NudJ n=1 Tax=Methylomonas lenta TaxID=980561 RepID=A0A177N723_9GAMM|nr:NUDIX hydrolase [Methylomonas lenta]MDD2739979.1 NUDIX hydrolase [Methylomonas lenta]OAI13645.1 NUDIX hydrolase [Methylomonas lenta]